MHNRFFTSGESHAQTAESQKQPIHENGCANRFSGGGSQLKPNGSNGYSRPFFATGEHVLTGEQNQAAVRTDLHINGVSFNYSEIITMGDFYETFNDMMKANPTQLRNLQALIRQSREYAAAKVAGKTPGVTNPGDADWQRETDKKYMKLAEENYSHFSPSNMALIPGFTSSKKNNKTEWETYHRRAVEHSKKGTNSDDLADALVINAFADHFLTDAFAAGHLFNKDDINQLFKSRTLSGKSVNSAGQKFFENLANEAFKGKVKSTFSNYEITSRDADKGFILWNIDTTNAFRKLLIQIMEKEPDVFGKTVVSGAVHDILNNPQHRTNLPVKNNKGDRWNIMGDSSMDSANLAIIQKAVNQSVENVYNVVSNPTTPIATYYKKVWDFVPQPEPLAVNEITKMINLYTDPSYIGLVFAGAKMIEEKYLDILDELVKRNYLKKA